MGEFNPIAMMQRLEAQGVKRQHAEALAQEMQGAIGSLVTKTDLEAALAKQALRICAALGAAMALGFTALGVLISSH